MTVSAVLDESLWPVIKPVQEALDAECGHDPVLMMKVLEMLTVRMIMGVQRQPSLQNYVADSFHKHVRQILVQWRRFEAEA